MSGRQHVFRFGAGEPPSKYSAVWRLWFDDPLRKPKPKSDVYLANRTLGGTFKTSLHESGKWRTGFTSESGGDQQADRKLMGWPRPAEWSPGVTLAFLMVFPSSELRLGPASDPQLKGSVTWIPDPGPGRAVEVSILLLSAELGGLQVTNDGGARPTIHEITTLANGQHIAMVSRALLMPDDMKIKIREASRVMLNDATKSDIQFQQMNRPRAMLFINHSSGACGIFDVAMPCTV